MMRSRATAVGFRRWLRLFLHGYRPFPNSRLNNKYQAEFDFEETRRSEQSFKPSTLVRTEPVATTASQPREEIMGRGILLLLLGVPLPIVILLALFWH
jgi:hypothetical protein